MLKFLFKVCAKKNRYLFRIFNRIKLLKIPLLPTTLDIEPTNRCNYKCPHCQVSYWNKEKKDLELSSFKKILNQFPHLSYIKLQGMGEPSLCPDLLNMIEYVGNLGIKTEIILNGSFIDDTFILSINKLNRTIIRFSLDGYNSTTMTGIRPDNNFERIKTNIKKLVVAWGKNKFPEISLWTLLTNINIQNIELFIPLVKELGVAYLTIQTKLITWGKPEFAKQINELKVDYHNVAIQAKINNWRNIAKEKGVEINIYEDNYYSTEKKCSWPFTSAFIAVNGDVVPCCIIGDSSTIKMGNIFEQNFREIWNSQKYIALRKSIKDHNLNSFGKNCYIN